MNLDKALSKRASVREYIDKKIPMGITWKIIEAGCMAPSLHNLQPWHFLLLNKRFKRGIADILRKRADRELVFLNTLLRNNATSIENAPLVIVVYNTKPLSERFKRFGRYYGDRCRVWEIQSVACCMENMFLKAASLGLGGLLIGCSLLCEKQINRLLGADKELMGVLVFGYPRRYTKQARKNNPRETTTLL